MITMWFGRVKLSNSWPTAPWAKWQGCSSSHTLPRRCRHSPSAQHFWELCRVCLDGTPTWTPGQWARQAKSSGRSSDSLIIFPFWFIYTKRKHKSSWRSDCPASLWCRTRLARLWLPCSCCSACPQFSFSMNISNSKMVSHINEVPASSRREVHSSHHPPPRWGKSWKPCLGSWNPKPPSKKYMLCWNQNSSKCPWKETLVNQVKLLCSGFWFSNWWHHVAISLISGAASLPNLLKSTTPRWCILLRSHASKRWPASCMTLRMKPLKELLVFLSEQSMSILLCMKFSATPKPIWIWSRRWSTLTQGFWHVQKQCPLAPLQCKEI